MRIAYLTADFGVPVLGTKGASVHVRKMVEALAGLGHDVMLITPAAGGGDRRGLPCQLLELPLDGISASICTALADEPVARGTRLAKDLRNLLYAAWLEAEVAAPLGAFAPAFIYERYCLLGTAGLRLARRLDVPLLLEVNAPLVQEQQEQRGLSLPQTAEAAERLVMSGADHVLAVSRALADHAVAAGAAPARVTVLPNAADPQQFAPRAEPSEARGRLRWQRHFVVGFTGSMKSWHGVSVLLEAVGLLVRGRVPWPGGQIGLLLVGDGPQRPALLEQARALKLNEKNVHFTGAVPHETVPEWIAAMDVAVAPYAASASAYFSPVKLFEYMAMGVPVVAARLGQVTEIIDDGRTGWLCEPGDAVALAERLARIAADRQAAAAIGAAGRKRVLAAHTWAKSARRVVEIASLAKERGFRGAPDVVSCPPDMRGVRTSSAERPPARSSGR